MRKVPSFRYEQIWQIISRIPSGRVATYGQIAEAAGMEGHARLVGYALHALPAAAKIPWHRVINAQGRISLSGPGGRRQRKLLESEGVRFGASGRIPLAQYRHNFVPPYCL